MKKIVIKDKIQKEIYDFLKGGQYKFTVNGFDFKETVFQKHIEKTYGSTHGIKRDEECRKKSLQLFNLIN